MVNRYLSLTQLVTGVKTCIVKTI